MLPEELDYFNKKFNEIPKDILEKAVNFLSITLTYEQIETLCDLIDTHGLHDWIHAINGHHGWGMAVRNEFRKIGLTDDLLPDGNWDDYYVSVIEVAVGKRGSTGDWWQNYINYKNK